MKKKTLVFFMSATMLLVGCSSNEKTDSTDGKQNQSEETVVSINKEEKGFVYNGLELNIKDVSVDDTVDQKGEDKELYTVTVSINNISDEEQGIGAIDFLLIDKDGKEHTISEEMNAFGGMVEPGAESEEKVFFLLNPDQSAEKIAYKPAEDVVKEWAVN